jgi:3-hydroxymyristoyl/3-hydroxydecanoyl-(acyl carrier protein) dehydratase
MHVNGQLAAELAAGLEPPAPARRWRLRAVQDIKFRAFISPGDVLHSKLRVDTLSAESATLAVETRNTKRLVLGARIEFLPEAQP